MRRLGILMISFNNRMSIDTLVFGAVENMNLYLRPAWELAKEQIVLFIKSCLSEVKPVPCNEWPRSWEGEASGC